MNSIRNIVQRLHESRINESSKGIISFSIDEDKLESAMKKEGYGEDEFGEFLLDIYGLEDGEDFQTGNGYELLFYKDTGKDDKIEKLRKDIGESVNESKDGMTLEDVKAEINKYVQNYNLDKPYGQLFNILKYLRKNGILKDEAKKIASEQEKALRRENQCDCGALKNNQGECPKCDPDIGIIDDSFDPNEGNAATVLDKIEKEVKEGVRKFMMLPEIGFPEDEVEEYSRVSATIPGEDYIKVTVGAELSYGALSDLCDALNPIVAKYDKDSYFEPVEPGIISAYIY